MLPWTSLDDDQLVARCRQRPGEVAWETFGERYGSLALAVPLIAWLAYARWPVPWYGWVALLVLYPIAAFTIHLLVFLLPANIRAALYARELGRRLSPLPSSLEIRRARRLFDGADPPDWILVVQSDPGAYRWTWTRLTLFESPPRGFRQHRSGPIFRVSRERGHNPIDEVVCEDRILEAEECLSILNALRAMDPEQVADVEARGCGVSTSWLTILRRHPRLVRKVRISHVGASPDPESRKLPTWRLVGLATGSVAEAREEVIPSTGSAGRGRRPDGVL
ncbi:hypothetical protein OJF2_78070 [Aquisphaera giovannonii]|uniref:Uncharacterized protein n=1 Tax=Aquisphaera giovannonii TaxID=406548 RepID=A0A5B9WGR9_9BACT|nr:hypothetical protein [Aquisphaera giovannonii]QEH39195.1 hypothetical protein OJF2_78070 [Aquisphaera giovannonii]